MQEKTGNEPAIYVGTYRKYNNGSLRGEWVDLFEHPTKEEFYNHIKNLHADEDDPEYMFQDYENFPDCFYGESCFDDRLWDWLDLDENQRQTCAIYFDNVSQEGSIEDALERSRGAYDNKEAYAREILQDCGSLANLSEELQWFFDFEAYANNLENSGDTTFVEKDGQILVFTQF
jgi:antirestriction protein